MHKLLTSIDPIDDAPGMPLLGFLVSVFRKVAANADKLQDHRLGGLASPVNHCHALQCLCGLVHPIFAPPSPETRSNYFAVILKPRTSIARHFSRFSFRKAWKRAFPIRSIRFLLLRLCSDSRRPTQSSPPSRTVTAILEVEDAHNVKSDQQYQIYLITTMPFILTLP